MTLWAFTIIPNKLQKEYFHVVSTFVIVGLFSMFFVLLMWSWVIDKLYLGKYKVI
jgi:hypothetical protein